MIIFHFIKLCTTTSITNQSKVIYLASSRSCTHEGRRTLTNYLFLSFSFFPSPLSRYSVPAIFNVCNPKLKASEYFCSFHKPLRTGSGTDYEKLFLKRPYVSVESMDQKATLNFEIEEENRRNFEEENRRIMTRFGLVEWR